MCMRNLHCPPAPEATFTREPSHVVSTQDILCSSNWCTDLRPTMIRMLRQRTHSPHQVRKGGYQEPRHCVPSPPRHKLGYP
eukprot:80521-Pelagomonas_calceolata.AAC.2